MHAHTLITHTQIPPLSDRGERETSGLFFFFFFATKKLICTVSVLTSWCVRSCWRISDVQRTEGQGDVLLFQGSQKGPEKAGRGLNSLYIVFSKEFTRKIGETPHLRSTQFIQSQESTFPAT